MSSTYDVRIGKLISGKRELEGKGRFWLCTPDKEILEVDANSLEAGVLITSKDIEDALYEYCLSAIAQYIQDENNKDVYTFSIFTDSYHGSYIIYINNLASLNETVDNDFVRCQKKFLENGNDLYNRTREQLYQEFKYAEGDYPFMYEDTPDHLEKWLSIFYSISTESPDFLDIEQNYIFEKQMFDSQLFLIAIDVIHRLQNDFIQLDRTDDFIAYVSAADGVGGDYLTTSQLVRRCVTENQLHKAMVVVRKKDLEFEATLQMIKAKSLQEQVSYWVALIECSEYGEGSMRSFWKTDYEAYEQLVLLGSSAGAYIQDHLSENLKKETKKILEMVLIEIV